MSLLSTTNSISRRNFTNTLALGCSTALLPQVKLVADSIEVITTNNFSSEIQQIANMLNLSNSDTQLAQAVFDKLPDQARINFTNLSKRLINPNLSTLMSTDIHGSTLLQNLAQLTTKQFHSELENNRSIIIRDFLHELADPGQLNQGYHGTCGTGLIYQLYLQQPAEACRIMSGLLSRLGETIVRNGATIKLAQYVFSDDRSSAVRSISEKIMQSALMELANGSDWSYCNLCDEHFNPKSGEIKGIGLTVDEIVGLYAAIFGKSSVYYINDEHINNTSNTKSLVDILEIIEKKQPDFIPASLRWSSGLPGSKLERRHLAEQAQGATLSNEPHHILTGGPSRSYGPDGYHFVLITETKNDRVLFRNLHGSFYYQLGQELKNPDRRVEDPQAGIESMSLADFSKRIHWILDVSTA